MLLVYSAAILGGICYGIAESLNKNITEKKYSAFSYAFLQWGLNAIFYLIPFLFFAQFPKTLPPYIFLLGVLSCNLGGNLTIIKAYKTEDLSNINILSRFSLVIGFLSGVILLHEKVSSFNIAGVIAIILGIIIIFYEGKGFKPSPGYFFAVFSGLLYGLVGYFQKMALNSFNIISLIFIFNLSASLSLLLNPKTIKDIKPIWKKHKKKILLSRIGIVVGVFLVLWSIKEGNISIVNTNIETSFLLSTAFIGIFFLNEKKSVTKKLLGSIFCTLGIVLLNFF